MLVAVAPGTPEEEVRKVVDDAVHAEGATYTNLRRLAAHEFPIEGVTIHLDEADAWLVYGISGPDGAPL